MLEKECLFCGEKFTPRSNRQLYCDREHFRFCPRCGKKYIEKYNENLSKPPRLCSSRCSSSKNHILPPFQEIDRIAGYAIIDSTSLRNKYDNLTISRFYDNRGTKCVHLFPEDNLSKIESWCDRSKRYDASEFQTYKLNLYYAKEFIDENDIVKFNNSTSIAIGLVKNNQIFQILSFCKPRYSDKYDYEISHTCTKLGCRIVGGLDSLSSSASLLLGVTSCICYIDVSKCFDCSEYLSIGLQKDHYNYPRLRPSSVFDCGTYVYTFK